MTQSDDPFSGADTGERDFLNDPIAFAAAGSAAGRAWLAGLPAIIGEICRRWGVELEDGIIDHGFHALVLPVRRGNDASALKLTWPADRAGVEATALAAWGGHGAVRMLEADLVSGAILLERLDARRTLRDVNLDEAAVIAGQLLRRLAVPAPPGLPKLTDLVRDIAHSLAERQTRLGHPVPAAWLDAAQAGSRRLVELTSDRCLVHADLHYGNILAGEREPWLAIDPKPIAGDPERAVPELLWTRVDEREDAPAIRDLLAAIIKSGELDAEKAYLWAIVRSVDYWLWAVEHGLTEDPKRCERILEAFIENRS